MSSGSEFITLCQWQRVHVLADEVRDMARYLAGRDQFGDAAAVWEAARILMVEAGRLRRRVEEAGLTP